MLLTLTVFSLLGSCSVTRAQNAVERRRAALLQGTHAFRRVLYDVGFQALSDFSELSDDPKSTLLVVLGETTCMRQLPAGTRLRDFVDRGGGVLLATDQNLDGSVSWDVRELTGVRSVVPRQRRSFLAPTQSSYRGQKDCPFLTPYPGQQSPFFRLLPVQGIATNRPAYLEPDRRKWPWLPVHRMARYPDRTVDQWGNPHRREPSPILIVGGEVGDGGQILLVADHSMFLNMMMIPRDNDNAEFAYNCLAWFRGKPVRRTKVLFVEDGRIQTKLDIPVKDVVITPEQLARLLFPNRNLLLRRGELALARLEREGEINRWFFVAAKKLRLGSPRTVIITLLTLISLSILGLTVYRLGIRGRFRTPPRLASLDRKWVSQSPDTSLLAQRHQALLRANSLWETAHTLARQFFAGQASSNRPLNPAGGLTGRRRVEAESNSPSASDLSFPASPQAQESVFLFSGKGTDFQGKGGTITLQVLASRALSWGQQRKARQLIRGLWQLAQRTQPRRVTVRDLRRYIQDIEEANRTLAEGSIRLVFQAG